MEELRDEEQRMISEQAKLKEGAGFSGYASRSNATHQAMRERAHIVRDKETIRMAHRATIQSTRKTDSNHNPVASQSKLGHRTPATRKRGIMTNMAQTTPGAAELVQSTGRIQHKWVQQGSTQVIGRKVINALTMQSHR